MTHPVYGYREFLGEEFPFRIRVRNQGNYNREVHAHEHFQFSYVVSGSCEHHIGGKQAILIKGDFFSAPPYLEHILLPQTGTPFEVIEIDFMPLIINENMQDLSRMENFFDFAYIQPLVAIEVELLPKLNFSPSNQRLAEELIRSMQKEASDQEQGYRLSIKADLLKLLVIAGREFSHYRAGGKGQPAMSTHRRAFHEVIHYIKSHYTEELRLEDMVEKAFMSPTYFSTDFKLVKGRNFVEYVNDIRIGKEVELLLESDGSITEIGLQVGFNNIGHSNRTFKKKTGVTPSEYRKLSRSTT